MPNASSSSVTISFPRYDREELVERLEQGAASLREHLPLQRVVLFGSWASGRATAASDVDVLVVYDDPLREDAFALVKKTLPLRGVEPHVYTTKEVEQMASVIDRMTEEGLPIYTAEGSEE
jgi:predicted nucleotidyltransferase